MVISNLSPDAYVEQFAQHFIARIMGSADDQAVLNRRPEAFFVAGTLFPPCTAKRNLFSQKIAPTSLTVRFSIAKRPETLRIRVDFWVWIRYRSGDFPNVLHFVDFADSAPTELRPEVQQRLQANLQGDDVHLRKRFNYEVRVPLRFLPSLEGSFPLPLDTFRDHLRRLAKELHLQVRIPTWMGKIKVRDESKEIEVSLENTTEGRRPSSVFFDVSMDVDLEGGYIAPLPAQDLGLAQDMPVYAIAYSGSITESDEQHLRIEQVGQVHLLRQRPLGEGICPSFRETAEDPLGSVRRFLHRFFTEYGNLGESLQEAKAYLAQDGLAHEALSLVGKVFDRAPDLRGKFWRLHQWLTLLEAIANYASGFSQGRPSLPLVLNVPAATGKTEAFTAAAMWLVALNRLRRESTRDFALILYPTTLLLGDQVRRAALYVMILDHFLGEKGLPPCGLGIFYGRGRQSWPEQSSELVEELCKDVRVCPLCSAEWQRAELSGGIARVYCEQGHLLNVALADYVPYGLPGIILATVDKVTNKSTGQEMSQMVGAPLHLCAQHGYQVSPHCYKGSHHAVNIPQASERARCAFWVLDEAHLLSGARGSLAANYLTGIETCVYTLLNAHPLILISTATITGVNRFLIHLGFLPRGAEPRLIPPQGVPSCKPTDAIHHIVLAVNPRNRVISFAIPSLVEAWLDTLERDFCVPIDTLTEDPFGRLVLFFSSYQSLYQTAEEMARTGVKDRIGPRRMKEISRESLSREPRGVAQVIKNLQEGFYALVYSTSLISVGVDIARLNAMMFFGAPGSVSALLQTMNRVARDHPGIVVFVLGSERARDASLYTYLRTFFADPNRLIEEIPIDRYTRPVLDLVGPAVTYQLLNHVGIASRGWARGRSVSDMLNVIAAHGDEIQEDLQCALRVEFALSPDYRRWVNEMWEGVRRRLENSPRDQSAYDALGGRNRWGSLILSSPREVTVGINNEDLRNLRKAKVRAIVPLEEEVEEEEL
jgi:hypothetical protein